jgi:hypothetical protein
MRPQIRVACLAVVTALLGCSHDDTVEVLGTVTWEGQPISQGDIVFGSVDPRIRAAAGKIVDGKYEFRCLPGAKRVEIRCYRLTGKTTDQGNREGQMFIPKRYNNESTLTANVTSDGENKFDFPLKP